MKKIIVLGGGLAGLSAALNLNELNKELNITILEKNSYFGGLASSFEHEKVKIPLYYHHIIYSNKTTIKYLKKYNLLKNPKWQRIKVGILNKNKLFNIQSIKGLLTYNGLSLYGKIRFGLFGIYSIFFMNPNKISTNLDAKFWLYKKAGKEVTNHIFYNLYARNKFNTPLKKISAKQLANRLSENEVFDKFTYPQEQLDSMIQGLISDLKKEKVELLNKINIISIDLKKKELVYKQNSKIKKQKFDILLNTIPIPEFLKITKGLPNSYKYNLKKLKYCPAVSISFGTDKFLDDKHYWINLFQQQPHIIMQHSILNNNYPWKISWILRYGGSEEDINKSDTQIKKEYLAIIKKYFPHVKIIWSKVFKEKYGEPLYDKDYVKYAPKYVTPIEYLFMAGIQVTYPKIRNMNVALQSGEKVAKIINNSI